MNFSVDTNIIIGIVNVQDRLHETSIKLMEHKKSNNLILCETVLAETENVLITNINNIIVMIIPLILPLKNTKSNIGTQLLDKFEEIKAKEPGKVNFINLLSSEIADYLDKNKCEYLPQFLSELSMKYSGNLVHKIKEKHYIYQTIKKQNDKLSNIKMLTNTINFNDSNDERIFYDLMTNLNGIVPIEFYSGDGKFVKKMKEGYQKIADENKLKSDAFVAICCEN